VPIYKAEEHKMKTVVIIGSMDTKGEEFAYLKRLIEKHGLKTLVVDASALDEPKLKPDVSNSEVAKAVGANIEEVVKMGRGEAMAIMSKGAEAIVDRLYKEGKLDGIIGMGGSGGTAVATAGMRSLPVGVPKVMVSTVAASSSIGSYIGTRDITVIPSVVDVAGLNRISRKIYANAAGAIAGMLMTEPEETPDEKPLIAATMFGNTTPCVDRARAKMEEAGYEVLVFHCTGTGGRTMEDLIADGFISGVLDITTTEWADELVGGVFSAGPTRLDSASKAGIPQVIAPGCVDMVNFGAMDTIPDKFKGRIFYQWNPNVTLMRTTPQENAEMGRIFAEKANASTDPVVFMLPLKGVSMLDSEGEIFWLPEADKAIFDAIKQNVRKDIKVIEMDVNINDPSFADRAVQELLNMLK
jgi:uncharacterized protein (UPF0261 family)